MLLTLRALGFFGLARLVTRSQLRILGYHGISLGNEHEFRPGVFMHPVTFRRRMEMLQQRRYPVLKLKDALERLNNGSLPDCATVITIDDGWTGTATIAAAILQALGLPSTLYLTTYHVKNRTQVFGVALEYSLLAGSGQRLVLDGLAEGLFGSFDLSTTRERSECLARVLYYAESVEGAEGRQDLLDGIVARLGLSDVLNRPGLFRIVSAQEAECLPALGMDIQLHTHRHRFPSDDRFVAEREIADNRRELSKIVVGTLEHFCYPSGEYDGRHEAWLKEWGVVSAMTCDIGLNAAETNPYFLRRILDSERLSDIEIEAELSGIMELKRQLARWIGRSGKLSP